MFNKIYENIKKIIKEYYQYLLFLLFIIFLFNFELPYVVEIPGGFISLDERVEVSGGYDSAGEMGMAYVSMLKGNIPFILASFLSDKWDLVPKSDIKYDNETMKELNEREKILMEEAVDNAIINAYKYANKPYNIVSKKMFVTYLDSPDTELELLDIINSIEGVPVDNLDTIKSVLDNYNVGDEINIEVERDGKNLDVKTVIQDMAGEKKIGISFNYDYELETEPEVNIKIKDNESGPSGGLMMSLAVYDSLIEEDLTKGKKIIGTGTIDADGNVGAIGGVKYKLIGAVNNDAEIFICPKDNLDEALAIKEKYRYNIGVLGVATFEEAVEELRKL